MKKLLVSVLCLICAASAFAGASKEKASDAPVLVVYATESFLSEWGPAPVVFPKFEEKYGIKIEQRQGGSAGEIVNLAIMEKGKAGADIIIGVDNISVSLFQRLLYLWALHMILHGRGVRLIIK